MNLVPIRPAGAAAKAVCQRSHTARQGRVEIIDVQAGGLVDGG